MERNTINDLCDFSTDLLIDEDFDSVSDEELPHYTTAVGEADVIGIA